MLAKLRGAKVFSTIDLRSGYYHIGLTREARPKSAFVVPMGKWEFRKTPFGLSQAPAMFQLLIDNVLMEYSEFAMGYLDDIIIFSRNEEEHLIHLEKVFQRLEKYRLKMKRSKCAFFKKHIQYLGHVVSAEGFKPLPEKLESIRKMPAPKNQKEVKQFLGLIGYYRKFIPRFSDIAKPLTMLTRHDQEFRWTDRCQKAFELMKGMMMKYPILRYPDTSKSYTLFTDASKLGWAGVLTQTHEDEKGVPKQHPICYVSGLFRGSQLNWAALTKEAYAIYMSVKRLTFYLMDSETTIKTDHRPLKKFLEKTTLNAKVNNWAIELEQFKLKIDWIMGRKNTLADVLSRLLEVIPEAEPEKEQEGHEFGVPCFEELEPAKVLQEYAEQVANIAIKEEEWCEVKIPLKKKQLSTLQKQDRECREIVKKRLLNEQTAKIYMKIDGILTRIWTEEEDSYNCTVVPKVLRLPLLTLAHDLNGHNGGKRTYAALKRTYYWPGMKKEVFHHCKACPVCSKYNQTTTETQFSHFTAPDGPMQLICMDLIGPIEPVSSRRNRFCLTIIDMLTGFVMAVPIPDKKAETICNAYRDHLFCTFGGSSRMLTDNGTEFKNKLMDEVCEKLAIKHVYCPVYTPQANGKLEGFHRFFKACIGKHVRGSQIEWDAVVPLAASAYNFFPCQASRESPFFLMFGRDPIAPFSSLLEPAPKYYGEKGGHLELDALQRMYQVTAENLKKAREKENELEERRNKFKIGDLVLVKDINSNVFEPKFTPHFRVVAIYGPNNIKVKNNVGKTQVRRAAHLKLMDPVDKVVAQTPAEETFRKFGRVSKLQLPKSCIPDLNLKLPPIENSEENASDAEKGSSHGKAEQCTEVAEIHEIGDKIKWKEIQQNRIPHQEHDEIPAKLAEKTVKTGPAKNQDEIPTLSAEKTGKTETARNQDEIPTRFEEKSSAAELSEDSDEIPSYSSRNEATKDKQVSMYKGKGEGTREKGNHRSFWDKVASFSATIMRGNSDHTESEENTNANATPWVTEINLM